MNAKPILFSTEMVQAILAGRKTQTRRIVKNQPNPELLVYPVLKNDWDGKQNYPLTLFFYDEKTKKKSVSVEYQIAPYQIGDILWVRETLYQEGELGLNYFADNERINEDIIPLDFKVRLDKNGNYKFCKIPNIFMKKFACRIFLKVKNVKVERLQDISEEDAISEGFGPVITEQYPAPGKFINYISKHHMFNAVDSFVSMWLKLQGNEAWKENPFVWVYEFETTEKPDNF